MPNRIALFLFTFLVCACHKATDPHTILADPSLLDNSEAEKEYSFALAASNLLSEKDYDGLEKLAATDRALESPVASGTAPISDFYDGIAGTPNNATEASFQQELSDLDAWTKARPDSVTARIACANAQISYAWFSRGSGWANTVTDAEWAAFRSSLAEASRLLLVDVDKRRAYPDWYSTIEMVGMGQSWPKFKFLKLSAECASQYPTDADPYTHAVIYLLPRWEGTNAELANFITTSADRVGGDEGDILYARLAACVWTYSCDTDVFSQTGLSCARVKHGMGLICRRFPHSSYAMNCFCVFACQAHDHDAAHVLFDQLGDHFLDSTWPSREEFEADRTWSR